VLAAAAGIAGVAGRRVDQRERIGGAVADVDRVRERVDRDPGREAADLDLRVVGGGAGATRRCRGRRRGAERDRRRENDRRDLERAERKPSGLSTYMQP